MFAWYKRHVIRFHFVKMWPEFRKCGPAKSDAKNIAEKMYAKRVDFSAIAPAYVLCLRATLETEGLVEDPTRTNQQARPKRGKYTCAANCKLLGIPTRNWTYLCIVLGTTFKMQHFIIGTTAQQLVHECST